MINKKNLDLLNSFYQPLCQKSDLVYSHLLGEKLNAELNWFNGHSIKIENNYYFEYYPIPLITINNIDIGFSFSGTFIDVTCSKDFVLNLDYQALRSVSAFEFYDGNDYLTTVLDSTNNITSVIQAIKSDNIHIYFAIEENNYLEKIQQIINFFLKH